MLLSLGDNDVLGLGGHNVLALSPYFAAFDAASVASFTAKGRQQQVFIATAVTGADLKGAQAGRLIAESQASASVDTRLSIMLGFSAVADLQFTYRIEGQLVGQAAAGAKLKGRQQSIFVASVTTNFEVTTRQQGQMLASAIAGLLVEAPEYRPTQPLQVRVERNPASPAEITVNWLDGLDTARVIVRRSLGQREIMSDTASVSAGTQTVTQSVGTELVASYQLVPLGVTGKKGRASVIVYSAPNSQIL